MAKIPAKSMLVWLDEHALAGFLSSAGVDYTQEIPKVDTLGEEGPRRVVGNYDYMTPFLGLFDGDDDSYDEILHSLLGDVDDHMIALAMGSSIGSVVHEGAISLQDKPLSGQIGSAQLLNFTGAGRLGASRGVLFGNKTTTGAESLAGVEQGATTSGQLYRAVFRVLAFSGTNITLKLQGSSDNGSGDAYADIAGLTSGALTGVGTVVATTTAALEAWRRLNISGTFTSAVIVVTGGLVAGDS